MDNPSKIVYLKTTLSDYQQILRLIEKDKKHREYCRNKRREDNNTTNTKPCRIKEPVLILVDDSVGAR